jgi:hypothetical protein
MLSVVGRQSSVVLHSMHYPLLGLPLEIHSNDANVLATADEAFSPWHVWGQDIPATGRSLRVEVHVGPAHGRPNGRFAWFHQGPWFIANDGPHTMSARTDLGEAIAFITPALAADKPNLRYNVIECLGLLLASFRDRTPVHAGAIVRDKRAIMLVGPSGTGKSSLCYAAVRAGFRLLAEDVVYVGLDGGLSLWGCPWRLHLLGDAVRFFPELAGLPVTTQANGKQKLALSIEAIRPGAAQPHAREATVCFVERATSGTSTLEPMSADEAYHRLISKREPGFDLHNRIDEVAAALVATQAYRLRMGYDPKVAVKLLRTEN